MSFWDHLKPAPKAPTPTAVDFADDKRALEIRWDDGRALKISARTLRQSCPCAECVEEWSGKRTFDPKTIPEGTGLRSIAPVGNYALSFAFSDGHGLGIYSWSLLRELSERQPA